MLPAPTQLPSVARSNVLSRSQGKCHRAGCGETVIAGLIIGSAYVGEDVLAFSFSVARHKLVPEQCPRAIEADQRLS
jgi:hypothetical protein